jgi:hypothetical protein
MFDRRKIACVSVIPPQGQNVPQLPSYYFGVDLLFEQIWNLLELRIGDLLSTMSLAPSEQLTLEFQSSQRRVLDKDTVDSTEEMNSTENTTIDKEAVNVTSSSSQTNNWYVDATGIRIRLCILRVIHSTYIFLCYILYFLLVVHVCLEPGASLLLIMFTGLTLLYCDSWLFHGGGHQYIQAQYAIVFEKIEEFKKFEQPSRRFMQFEEQLLTDNKGDPCQSFTTFLLRSRIP